MLADDLSRLAAKYGTDKFGVHKYTPVYHGLLNHYRGRKLRVLEIGVGGYGDADRGGQSLAMLRDYFPDATVVGIDIQRKIFDLGPRVTILCGSQVDPDFLETTVRDHGPFDIIIDDGSHQNEHIIESFKYLYPTLAPGGTYLAEDVQTSFFPRRGGSTELTQPNSVGFFRDYFLNLDPDHGIARVLRFHNIIAICKPPTDKARDDQSLMATATARSQSDAASWRHDFAALAENEALHIAPKPSEPLAAELAKLFVDLDHREIAIHFPQYVADPLARDVLGMERTAAGIFVVKGKNDYPSNFDFDIDHPEVREVCAAVEQQLQDDPSEGGLVSYAALVTRYRNPASARSYLDQLAKLGSTSGTYFQMAITLAHEDGDPALELDLHERHAAARPDDPDVIINLAKIYQSSGRYADCVAAVERAVEMAPRQAKLRLHGARLLLRADEVTKAIDHARQAFALSPVTGKGPAREFLALALSRSDALAEALGLVEPFLDVEGPRQSYLQRFASGLYKRAGQRSKAVASAERALALDPASHEKQAWLISIRRWAEDGTV